MAKELGRIQTDRAGKTIGVEIELFVNDLNALVIALAEKGVRAHVERYNHATPSGYWKIVTDGSLDDELSSRTRGMSGYELVSPPLDTPTMAFQLHLVCQALKVAGAEVNKSCGFHVHHDIKDLSLDHIKNVYRLYDKHHASLEAFFPRLRRAGHNGYCMSLKEERSLYEGGTWYHVRPVIELVEEATSIQDMQRLVARNQARSSIRYTALNFCSYISYGTLEFRQHSGTTNYDKMIHWVMLTQAMIAAAVRKRKIAPLTAHMATREVLALTRDIFVEGTVEAKYYENRRREIKKLESSGRNAI